MKSIVDLIDYTGLTAFIYSAFVGVAVQLGITEINVTMLITSIGGFMWIVAKTVMMFKKHAIEAAEKQHDLKVKIHDFEAQKKEDRKKAIQELFNITTVTGDEDLYKKADEIQLKYMDELKRLIKEKKGAKK